jgi:hypothetical protein
MALTCQNEDDDADLFSADVDASSHGGIGQRSQVNVAVVDGAVADPAGFDQRRDGQVYGAALGPPIPRYRCHCDRVYCVRPQVFQLIRRPLGRDCDRDSLSVSTSIKNGNNEKLILLFRYLIKLTFKYTVG